MAWKYKNTHKPYGFYEKNVKRALDILISGSAIILLSPVFLLVYLFVKKEIGTPVLFTQNRPGKDEKIFKLYKFRTMTQERDRNGELLPDELRLTKSGKLLRATSLDELPELINIFIGDMSLIGPRPLLVKYLPYYKDEERKRHDVRPGLTGLAQINGRNFINWEQRFEYDIKYVNKITFLVDLKIFLGTIFKVLKHEDVMENASQVDFKNLDDERKKQDEI